MGRDFTIFRSLGQNPSLRTEPHDSRWLNGEKLSGNPWEGTAILHREDATHRKSKRAMSEDSPCVYHNQALCQGPRAGQAPLSP